MSGLYVLFWRSINAVLIFSVLFINLSGCAWTDDSGIRHTLIVGLGYVSQASSSGINVSDVGALGVAYDQGLGIGLVRNRRVGIDPNIATNAIISIKATPFSLNVKNINPYVQPAIPKEEKQHDH